MKKLPVIAVDGYSSTGKSSISKSIAERLGLIHLDTGALYRAITYYALLHCTDGEGNIKLSYLLERLPEVQLEFRTEDGEFTVFLNGKSVSRQIRSLDVSNHVSFIAKQPEIRQYLLETQRNAAKNGGVILDGRDIGTVVLPDADYKFFMTAGIEERTRRRHAEMTCLGHSIDLEEVKSNLLARDKTDSEREWAPLRQAPDAILIDNSHLDKEQTTELMLSYLK